MQGNTMKPPPAPQSPLFLSPTSFPVAAGNNFIPNTQLLLNQLGNLSNFNILALQQQFSSITPTHQQSLSQPQSLVASLSDVGGHSKRKLEHLSSEATSSSSQAKSQRSSSNGASPANSRVDLVQQLVKERQDLSAALKASNDEVLRLREVVAQIMEADQRTKSEDDTDDSSHAQRRYWNDDEHQRFLEGLEKYGPKSVKAIAEFVGTRTATQVRTHAQKYYQKLARMRKSDIKASNDEVSGMSTEACESSTEQSEQKDNDSSETPEE